MADLTFTVTLDDSQLIAGLTNAENRLRNLGANTTQAFSGISAQLNNLKTGFDSLTATVAKTADQIQKLGAGTNNGLNNLTAALRNINFKEAEDRASSFQKAVNGLGGGSALTSLGSAFTNLTGIISGFLSLKFAEQTIEWAASIDNTARAVGFTVPQFLQFNNAVVAAGGSSRAAAVGIEMFYMKLDQARQGGLTQQIAFERLGITLKDLKDLSDREIFEKTVTALGHMPDNAERSRIEVELLSRAFRGIPLADIAKEMEGFGGGAKTNAAQMEEFKGAIYAGNEAFKNLIATLQNLKIGFLQAFEPMITGFANFKLSADDVRAAFVLLQVVIGVLISVYVGKLTVMVIEAGGAFLLFARNIKIAETAVIAMGTAVNVLTTMSGWGLILKLVAGVTAAVASYYGINALMDSANRDSVKSNNEAATALEEKTKATMEATKGNQQVYTSYARLNEAIKENTQNFIENQKRAIEKIAIQDQMAAKGLVEQKSVQESTKVYDEYARKIDEVKSKLKEAEAARPEQEISRTAGTLRAQIKILEDAQKSMSEQAGKVAGALEQSKLNQTQKKIFSDEDIRVGKEIADLQVKLSELTMSTADRRLADIEKLKNADIARMTTELKNANNGIISDEQKAQVIEKVKKAYEDLIQAQERFNKEANTFDVGFTAAWQKFVDNAGTAADAGKMAFEGFSTGVDKAIDALTSRTKHSFKDMVADIILSMENRMLKNAFANMMGGLSNEIGGPSAGGLLNSLGLGGIATAFGLGGTAKNPVTPRSAVGFGDEPSAADAAVNASGAGFFSGIAASIGKFFGFADGGMVTTNSPVLVGERGPELISGAAGRTVTNASDTSSMLGGGTTHNHYYNINAVDAKSVATLFAENRMTMFGLVEQARRELPMRTR